MSKPQRFSPPAVGAGSLLTAFGILVLVVFALLCVSSAQAEAGLAEAAGSSVRAYYEADLQAEEIFARLRLGELPPGVERQEDLYRYSCPISDTQSLHITLSHQEQMWHIQRWQVVVTEPAAEEPTLNLWTGQ